jgi:hypothetical protein
MSNDLLSFILRITYVSAPEELNGSANFNKGSHAYHAGRNLSWFISLDPYFTAH